MPRGAPVALVSLIRCYYSNYMTVTRLKVARIGNSRGVRLPAASLRRYRIGESVLMEERSDGILLRPVGPAIPKLSWEETAKEMAASHEGWSAWEAAAADGLEDIPWQSLKTGRVAESQPTYRVRQRRRKRR